MLSWNQQSYESHLKERSNLLNSILPDLVWNRAFMWEILQGSVLIRNHSTQAVSSSPSCNFLPQSHSRRKKKTSCHLSLLMNLVESAPLWMKLECVDSAASVGSTKTNFEFFFIFMHCSETFAWIIGWRLPPPSLGWHLPLGNPGFATG